MATPPGPANNGLYANFSYPSQVMGRRYQSPPIIAQRARAKPMRQMVGGFLGDASISATGSDTGVSDPLPGAGFNWASLLTGVAQTASAVTGALHPTTVPKAPVVAAGTSPVLVAAGVGIAGLAAYFLLSGRRR